MSLFIIIRKLNMDFRAFAVGCLMVPTKQTPIQMQMSSSSVYSLPVPIWFALPVCGLYKQFTHIKAKSGLCIQ